MTKEYRKLPNDIKYKSPTSTSKLVLDFIKEFLNKAFYFCIYITSWYPCWIFSLVQCMIEEALNVQRKKLNVSLVHTRKFFHKEKYLYVEYDHIFYSPIVIFASMAGIILFFIFPPTVGFFKLVIPFLIFSLALSCMISWVFSSLYIVHEKIIIKMLDTP